ncbi:hypothetical protein C8Q77DRAFT_550863 [Trametes polyzona]|nr:hypothetical protein C8Q77DRAFT_550863 [Trametes polyzona]
MLEQAQSVFLCYPTRFQAWARWTDDGSDAFHALRPSYERFTASHTHFPARRRGPHNGKSGCFMGANRRPSHRARDVRAHRRLCVAVTQDFEDASANVHEHCTTPAPAIQCDLTTTATKLDAGPRKPSGQPPGADYQASRPCSLPPAAMSATTPSPLGGCRPYYTSSSLQRRRPAKSASERQSPNTSTPRCVPPLCTPLPSAGPRRVRHAGCTGTASGHRTTDARETQVSDGEHGDTRHGR